MKKRTKIVSIVTAISIIVSGGSLTAQAAKKPILNKKSVTVQTGKSVKLKVKNKAKKVKVTWKSKNKKVATVSKKGKVTGRKNGSTKIICTIKKGKKKVQLKCKVKVVTKNSQSEKPDQTLDASKFPSATKIPVTSFLPTATSTVKPSFTSKPTATPNISPMVSEKPVVTLEPTNLPEQTEGASFAPTESELPTVTTEPSSAPTETQEPSPTVAPTAKPVEVYTGNTNIQLGMALNDMEQETGTAAYTLAAEYEGCNWHIYNADYTKFSMILVKDNKVAGVYADGSDFAYESVNSATTTTLLETEGFAQYGSKQVYKKYTDNLVVVAYVDSLGDNTVEGIFVMEQMNSADSTDITASQEKISLEITNSFRAKNGLTALTWSDSAAAVARAHSQDMSDNDYFSHTSLDGLSPWDRMTAAGLTYSAAGENIAWGYWDGIDVTYGWINSEGHRNNMLSGSVTNLGVGIDSTCSYYTQLFYTPR